MIVGMWSNNLKLLGGVIKPKKNYMSDFLTRLVIEHDELREKQMKLQAFLSTENFSKVDQTQQVLLKIQVSAMETYMAILENRITLLSPKKSN